MIPVRFHRAARAEYLAAVTWYADRSSDAATGWIEAFEQGVASIRQLPTAWPRWKGRDDVRVRVLRRFPYSIVYLLMPAELLIVAVAHQRRRPDYWRPRLPR